jgi:hypothetical protein
MPTTSLIPNPHQGAARRPKDLRPRTAAPRMYANTDVTPSRALSSGWKTPTKLRLRSWGLTEEADGPTWPGKFAPDLRIRRRCPANGAIIYGDLIGKLDMLRIQCSKRPPHLNKRRLY